jgi:methyltransferase (TIGR00027 family)
MAKRTPIKSAETLAALRAAAAKEQSLAVRCEDTLARHFLGLKFRLLASIRPQPLLRTIAQLMAPGSYCYAIVRTRHFDETLLAETRAGAEQVVLLGAGYDSRPFRFREALAGVTVFEIDHPGTQARKQRILGRLFKETPPNLRYIPVDFNRDSFQTALAAHGFARDRRTLFLWEGVSYYLPQAVVEGVLDFVAGCASGSSIVFDYAIKAFVNGDYSTYGGKKFAAWLKKVQEPFLFGLDATETPGFLLRRKLRVVRDLGPQDLTESYLKTRAGGYLGQPIGHTRIVHARAGSGS